MKGEEKRKRLAIIDGKSVFYRGYYAMSNLSTKDGTPTGGVYGFAVMALEVIKRLEPDYVCVAWDKAKTNIRKRKEIYPEYKAGRKPAPPDFYEQIPLLHELLKAFGWPLYELDDYEADDIMGTLAVQASAKGIDTALITSDLDLLQVINDNVNVYALKKGLSNIELFNPVSFEQKYGVSVDQFLDMKSIKGDSSDNIPGAPGIGEKGAVELLQKYKTLDEIYDNLALIKDSLRKKLEAGKESVYMSKKIAAIWTDAPIKLDLAEVDGSKCNPEDVREVLQRLEFRTLVRQLPEYMHLPEHKEKTQSKKLTITKSIVVKTNDELKKLTLPEAGELVISGSSNKPHGLEPTLLTISHAADTAISFDLVSLDSKSIQEKLKTYIEQSDLVGYNLKSTIQILLSVGINPKKIGHDVEIGAFLLNPLKRTNSLSEMVENELDFQLTSLDILDGHEAAAENIAAVRKLAEIQKADLAKLPKMKKLAADIEWPIIYVLAAMEHTGIELDVEYLKEFAEQLSDSISDIEQEIYGHADQEFNIASPSQLADILFNKLNLPTQFIKKGKTGYSTAAGELDKLRGSHPIIDLITQYREITKLMNTYVQPLPEIVDANNRLHTTYSMTVAQTGRLSSHDPNLQNIPVRSDLGRKIRSAFLADKGNVLISADYSQFELRLAALLAGDKDLVDMFNRDVDVHLATAAQIYGRSPEDVTKNMRRQAKVVNFGVMYGLSPHGLASAANMTYEAAKNFIDKYFEVRPKLVEYIAKVKKDAADDGYVETLFGRRRPTPDVKSSNFVVREAAFRAAVNMPFQGTAADIMKLAMVKLADHLEKYPQAKMLLQIHDSILIEVPQDQAEKLAKEVKEVMENTAKLDVKLTVDTSVGANWGEL